MEVVVVSILRIFNEHPLSLARRWTEAQCRENLWTRKTCFINKKFDCKCGLGKLFKTNEEAVSFIDI